MKKQPAEPQSILVPALVIVLFLSIALAWNQHARYEQDVDALQQQITDLKSSQAKAPIATPETAEEVTLHAAVVSYYNSPNSTNDPLKLSNVKFSGDFSRFTVDTVNMESDTAVGYAKKVNGTWKILMLGTGGDPTEFYAANNIPKDLQDSL